MTIATHCKSVTGIEYDNSYVELANKLAQNLGLENVKFIHADFNDWRLKNEQEYDVVFSFSVYRHMNLTPTSNAEVLSELVKSGGYLVFESHHMTEEFSVYFPEYLTALGEKGFVKLYAGSIEGDEQTGRLWSVWRKES